MWYTHLTHLIELRRSAVGQAGGRAVGRTGIGRAIGRVKFCPSIYRGPVYILGNRVTAISGRAVGRAGGRTDRRAVGRTGQILTKYLSGAGVCTRKPRSYRGPVCHQWNRKKLSLERTTCLADKTNHPVERLSLNRSQCGSCSTKYDTSAGT